MSKIGSFLGRKPTLVADNPQPHVVQDLRPVIAAADFVPAQAELAAAPIEKPVEKNVLELDQELFFPIASQLGEENEVVRNLLIDAEHKIGELETIKRSIGRLVDPVSKTLRAFEEAKSEKLNMQSVLNNTRTAHAKLRDEFTASERRVATLNTECTKLREFLTVAQQSVSALENTRAEQSALLTTQRSQIADLQQHLQQQSTDLQVARDESLRFAERVAAADKRVVQLESDAKAAKHRVMLAEQECGAVQAMLDKALSDATQMSRKLLDTENNLDATQARLRQVEAAFAEAHTERTRFAAALDEANQTHRTEITAHNARFEALQARSVLSERLLEESRHTLIARADEINAYERRVVEATQSRGSIEIKLSQIEIALDERDARIKALEQAHAALRAQNTELARAIDTRENAYNRAQEKIMSLDGQIQLLEGQIAADRESMNMQAEELNAQVQRERLDRTMAEGALEAGRKDIARLLRELSAMQHRPGSSDAAAAVTDALVRFRSAA